MREVWRRHAQTWLPIFGKWQRINNKEETSRAPSSNLPRELFISFSTNVCVTAERRQLGRMSCNIPISFGRTANGGEGPKELKRRNEVDWWVNDFHRIRSRLCDTYIHFINFTALHSAECSHTRRPCHGYTLHMDIILFRFVFSFLFLSSATLVWIIMCGAEKLVWLVFQQQSAICDFFMCVSVSFLVIWFLRFFFLSFSPVIWTHLWTTSAGWCEICKFIGQFFVYVFLFLPFFKWFLWWNSRVVACRRLMESATQIRRNYVKCLCIKPCSPLTHLNHESKFTFHSNEIPIRAEINNLEIVCGKHNSIEITADCLGRVCGRN